MSFGLLFSVAASADGGTTRDNLLLAYQGDVDAIARYTAFAAQAESEGYRQAARLFRAAAESERVHASNDARALRRLGVEPAGEARPAFVRNTRFNLSLALAHESGERHRIYPRLVEQARRDGDPDVTLGFTLAHAAHESLVKLYQEAIADLRGMRDAGEELHVCGVCGHVAKGGPPHRCPVSLSTVEAFARVD